MSSPYRSTHAFSPTRRGNRQQHAEPLGTSVNIATAFSNSKNGSFSTRQSRGLFDSVANEENEEEDDNMDYLDIRNINHEAIKNDPELRDLSKNPSAFNTKQDISYFNHKLGYGLEDQYEIEDETEDDDEDDEFGVYAELERMVHNPAEERRQRMAISQMSSLSDMSHSPRRASPIEFPKTNDQQLDWQDKLIQSIYLILKPIVFLFFMIFWIVKEPVIRIVTFFTMVVSSVAVDPLFYAWSRLPNNQNWMPTVETRRKMTHWCTALLLILLSASAFKYYNSDHSLSNALMSLFHSVENPVYYNQSPDLTAIHKRLASIDYKLAEQSKVAHNEYTKLWTAIKDQQYQLKDQQHQLKDQQHQFKGHQVEFNNHQAQLKALQHKLDHNLRQMIEELLPGMLLVRIDKDGKFELSPQFYRTLQDTSFWSNFIRQNKQTIDKYLAGEMNNFLEQQKAQGTVISKDSFMKLISNDLIRHHQGNIDDSSNLNELIQAAVRNYHQDVLNTADFALESRGARIIHSKTSATFQPLSFWLRRLQASLGLSIWNHPPELAIRASTNVGDCWTMAGSKGTLAILLSQTVYVQSVTIDHPSRELLLDGIRSAPKDLEFFGLSGYPQKDHIYIPLGSVRYDIDNSNSSVQTFDLKIQPTQPCQAVLVKVNSNWGNPNHTDIYRIRVHGLPAEK